MRNHLVAALTLSIVSGLLLGCGAKVSSEDRVTSLRLNYEVEPDGFQPRRAVDGNPELVLSVRVVNKGRESLDALTVLVRVLAPTGEERAVRRLTLDTRGLRPGVGAQLSGVVPDCEVHEGDTVLLEREISPPHAERHLYPEYAGPP